MDEIKKFFGRKAVGYYLVAAATLLALALAIIFFLTYNNPDLDPVGHTNPMGNKWNLFVI